MKARQWIELAAVASATALCNAAIANDVDRAPGRADASVSSAVHQALAERNDARGSAALPQDESTNAAMNRAAELGTSVPGAPLASNEDGVDAGTAANRDDTPHATTNDESAAPANAATNDEPSTPEAATGSTTKDRSGAGASGTASGSESFDAWTNDYAARHDGHITRQEFLDEMGNRFDRLDSRHQGYLTPYEVEEVFIFTPADTTNAAGETGSANTQ